MSNNPFLIFRKFLQDYQCSRKHFMMTWGHRCNSMWGTTRLMQLKCMEHWILSWCGKQELYVFNFRKTESQGRFGRQVATFWQNLVYSFYMNWLSCSLCLVNWDKLYPHKSLQWDNSYLCEWLAKSRRYHDFLKITG